MSNLERDVMHRMWIDKYRATGDRWYLQKLFDAVEGMRHDMVRKYLGSRDHPKYEDYMLNATEGVIESVKRYDPNRHACWVTYAYQWISWRLSRKRLYLSRNKMQEVEVIGSSDDQVPSKFGGTYQPDNLFKADPYRFEREVELWLILKPFLAGLTPQQRKALRGRMLGDTFEDVWTDMGVSRQRVKQHMDKVYSKYMEFQREQGAV
jgi:RNA polymerase sigma factor (sigma-70 family)